MASIRIVKRYALALYKAASEESSVEVVLSDAHWLCNVIDSSKELRSLLTSPIVRHDKKKAVLAEIFSEHVSKLTMLFVNLLVGKRRESALYEVLCEYETICNDSNNRIKAHCVSAVELSEAVQNQLTAALTVKTGKTVVPSFSVNPELIGGISIQVKDVVYDGSAASQLKSLYKELSAVEAV